MRAEKQKRDLIEAGSGNCCSMARAQPGAGIAFSSAPHASLPSPASSLSGIDSAPGHASWPKKTVKTRRQIRRGEIVIVSTRSENVRRDRLPIREIGRGLDRMGHPRCPHESKAYCAARQLHRANQTHLRWRANAAGRARPIFVGIKRRFSREIRQH